MAAVEKILERLRSGGVIRFKDLQRLLEGLGFSLDRVKGSHHIYLHPDVPKPINIQRMGADAKPYQVRQVRDMIDEFNLKLEE